MLRTNLEKIVNVKNTRDAYSLSGVLADDLQAQAIRLLQLRAGGRYTLFEAGQLYQICLVLGIEDSRRGSIGNQENYWESQVCSCHSEEEAKTKLAYLLADKHVEGRKRSSNVTDSSTEGAKNE